jgi:Cyclic nucleotide-binding domain
MHSNTIELISTPTIMGSFIRKYSALTGISKQTFEKMFIFRPVTIGSYIDVLGASFRFFYSYHSIPCIGFDVTYCGKSIYFSADTFFDPEPLYERFKQGIFSKERYDSLVEVNWGKYDVILHEAGVPPIHTPTKVLAQFPDEVKKNMYLVHIAAKDVPKDQGLKAAEPGLTNTLIVDVNPQLDSTMQKLDLLSSIKFLNEIPLYKTRDLVRCCNVETFMTGQTIIKQNTFGSKFYIVMSGICKIFSNDPACKFSKFAYTGDYFGETALIDQGKRNAE